MEEIARWPKHVASSGGETGAVTFVQRFNSTLGSFVHFHVLVPDGVFTRADAVGAVVFREGPAPTRVDIANVAARVEKRMRRWLRRRGLLDDASPWVATAEGTLPERESVVPSRRPTSLGDGVVKVAGTRIAGAQLLRRIDRVDVLACRWGGRRASVAEISERNVIVAILAHLKLPTEALPLARARSPAFEGA